RAVLLSEGAPPHWMFAGEGTAEEALKQSDLLPVLARYPDVLPRLVLSHRDALKGLGSARMEELFFSGAEPGAWIDSPNMISDEGEELRALLALRAFQPGLRRHPPAIARLLSSDYADVI